MDWWGYTILGANALSNILVWVSKLYWAKEHKQAIEETIRAKDSMIRSQESHIKSLDDNIKRLESDMQRLAEEHKRERELFSVERLEEFQKSYKSQMEEYNDKLKDEIKEKEKDIKLKNDQIYRLSQAGDTYEELIIQLTNEKERLEKRLAQLTIESEEYNFELKEISEVKSDLLTQKYPNIGVVEMVAAAAEAVEAAIGGTGVTSGPIMSNIRALYYRSILKDIERKTKKRDSNT